MHVLRHKSSKTLVKHLYEDCLQQKPCNYACFAYKKLQHRGNMRGRRLPIQQKNAKHVTMHVLHTKSSNTLVICLDEDCIYRKLYVMGTWVVGKQIIRWGTSQYNV